MSGPARWICASILTVGTTVLGSCSVLGVRPAPHESTSGTLACSSALLPVLDLLGGVTVGIVGSFGEAVSVAIHNDGCGIGSEPCESSSYVVPLALGGILLASSVYGFVANGACAGTLPKGAKKEVVPASGGLATERIPVTSP